MTEQNGELLREKIAKLLAYQTLVDEKLETIESTWEWVVEARFTEEYYEKADQILAKTKQHYEKKLQRMALNYDAIIKGIERQEGERIIKEVDAGLIESDSRNMWYLNKRFWQALRGEK